MKKYIAIPARLQKEILTQEEIAELANYGEQDMTQAEIEEMLEMTAELEAARAAAAAAAQGE
jgi:hypothetical protein